MAKIKPFKALIYNPGKIRDLAKVVCPPYDIISPAQQQYYHDLHPYNLIHILLGKDIAGENKYQRSARYFKNWLKDKILIDDASPAIYFYSQEYKVKGEKRTRLGFLSLLHLGEGKQAAFAHEHTRLQPKEDRLRLLRQVKANLSPIFVIFQDKKRIIQRICQQYINGREPFMEVIGDDKIIHRLWRLDSPGMLEHIQKSMSAEDIFIADGHHRYEVACAYRDERKKRAGQISGEEDFNYILAYFTNTDPRGLSIFPLHRLVTLACPQETKKLLASLGECFNVEEVKDKAKFFFLMEKGGCSEHVLGMYKDRTYWLLRLKNIKILDREIRDKPKAYRTLDISILNTLVLKKALGYHTDNKERIIFSHCAEDFLNAVDHNPLSIAFFLNPVKIEQVISAASSGERMPAKSTYFYPKVLSGLVINKFNEGKG